ncbi:hypothetical protein HPP92_009505 [Vanilla planifolia]|uniref:Uncharacterized protein n=1 Tax=Vanilla planifolia TaxID=51239 RepID=A0A835RFY9_VANPL|nr:hypothetical protein HPP92_009505 [Vanilla planifolia]
MNFPFLFLPDQWASSVSRRLAVDLASRLCRLPSRSRRGGGVPICEFGWVFDQEREIQEGDGSTSDSLGLDEGDDITTESAAFVHSEPPQDDSGPPKVDSEHEVLHEKVKKQIIKEGHGQKPTKFSTCFIHYRAWVEKTLHKFEDTWQEQRPTELVLGKEKKQMTGLGIGVANLLYEVELIGFDEVKEGKARSDMTVEERIGAADRRKAEGNNLFKEDKLEEAMQQYEMAIAYMGDDFMFQLFGKFRDMALAVKNPCHLNMAACFIKQKRYEEAIGQCTIVLTEEENNVKALFRREKLEQNSAKPALLERTSRRRKRLLLKTRPSQGNCD